MNKIVEHGRRYLLLLCGLSAIAYQSIRFLNASQDEDSSTPSNSSWNDSEQATVFSDFSQSTDAPPEQYQESSIATYDDQSFIVPQQLAETHFDSILDPKLIYTNDIPNEAPSEKVVDQLWPSDRWVEPALISASVSTEFPEKPVNDLIETDEDSLADFTELFTPKASHQLTEAGDLPTYLPGDEFPTSDTPQEEKKNQSKEESKGKEEPKQIADADSSPKKPSTPVLFFPSSRSSEETLKSFFAEEEPPKQEESSPAILQLTPSHPTEAAPQTEIKTRPPELEQKTPEASAEPVSELDPTMYQEPAVQSGKVSDEGTKPSNVIGKRLFNPSAVGMIQLDEEAPKETNAALSNSQIAQDDKAAKTMTKVTPTTTTKLERLSIDHKRDDQFTAQATPTATPPPQQPKEISVNFNNVAMIEYIRFISRVSNKNFVFDDQDLQFNVTIISEEPTSIENLMAALLQELRIRNLSLIEQGNNIIIHTNPRVRAPSHIEGEGNISTAKETEIVTRVFRLNTLDPQKASEIIKPLLSDDALVETLRDTNNLIITDLSVNVNKISQLITTLDAPNSGVTVGQYVVRNGYVDTLVELASKIIAPIAQGNPYVLVPQSATNSIFIVSNPFIVEKALAILENLDLNEGRTKILSLEKLRYSEEAARAAAEAAAAAAAAGAGAGAGAGGAGGGAGGAGAAGAPGAPGAPGTAGQGATGGPGAGGLGGYNIPGTPGYNPNLPSSYPFVPGGVNIPGTPGFNPSEPTNFGPGGLGGGIGSEGRPGIFETKEFAPGGISTNPRWTQNLPTGHIERTLFFIYKLKYRKGDQIELSLRKIGDSLLSTGTSNVDLVSAIASSQWIEASNSLIFTGTYNALERIKELILEIDLPLRQVFIEVLILDTSIVDSLTYGVEFGTRFGGGETAGGEAFVGLGTALQSTVEVGATPGGVVPPPVNTVPTANGLFQAAGYTAAVIGRHLTHGGTQFSTIGALVQALYTDTNSNVILNPKIVTEDNSPAEIFVGSTQRYKTQSIANDQGSTITNNFQFIDVGATLRVTPQIGDNGIITLDIIQEYTNGSNNANTSTSNPSAVDVNLVPVLNKLRSTTRIHVPDGFFVIMSGMIQDQETDTISRIPCIGGIPILGGISKQQGKTDNKRNTMLFIRPLIVDTEDELEDITKRQQDIMIEKGKRHRTWNYEIDEAMEFFNIKSTNPNDYPTVR